MCEYSLEADCILCYLKCHIWKVKKSDFAKQNKTKNKIGVIISLHIKTEFVDHFITISNRDNKLL